MKKITFGLLCLCMLSIPLFADMSREELQQMYLDYLNDQNITAVFNEEYGDIEFLYGNILNVMGYWLIIDEKDQQRLCILKQGGYPLDTIEKKIKAPSAMAYAIGLTAYAKIYLDPAGENIIVIAETFLVSPEDFKDVFPELMGGIEHGLRQFALLMR